MYYEDRLQGGGFTRVLLGGAAAPSRRRRACGAASSSGCGRRVEPLDPRAAAALTDRISAAPALLDALAPLVGMLLRDAREVAA